MSRQQHVLLSVLLAAMLVLAGCGGPAGDQTTTTESTPADGMVGPTELNADTKSAHESALTEAGSFAATNNVTMTSNNSSAMMSDISITTEYAVNFEQDRSFSSSGGLMGTSSTYTAGDTTYQQTKMSEDTADKDAKYSVGSAPYNESSGMMSSVKPVNTTRAMGGHLLFTENVTYERVGTETHNGVEVAVFKAGGQKAIDELKAGMSDKALQNSSITAFESTVKVDDNGVVRYQRISMTYVSQGQEATVEITHEITGVGDTTVEEPGWLQYAKQNGDS